MAETKKDNNEREVIASNGDSIKIRNALKETRNLNSLVQTMMQKIKGFPLTRDQRNLDEIDNLHDEINKTIDRETERFVSSEAHADGRSMAEFINNLFTKMPKDSTGISSLLQNQTIETLMNDENGKLNMLLSERYKNMNSMYEDIRLVTEQLAELAEVIDTFRDNIVNSDNIIADISRVLMFKNKEMSGSENLVSVVQSMEEATGIKNKLKYVIIPETLKYGNFFVFAQPYSDFFAKFKALDAKFQRFGNVKSANMLSRGFESYVNTLENYTPTEMDKTDIHTLYESFSVDFKDADSRMKKSVHSKNNITEEKFSALVESYFAENVSVVNDPMVPLLEDYNVMSLSDPQLRGEIAKAMKQKNHNKNWNPFSDKNDFNTSGFQEGGIQYNHDPSQMEDKYKKEFGDINGVFVKCYHPKRVIPIFVMDYCIGYYLIYENIQEVTSTVLNSIHTITRSTRLFQTNRTREFEERFVGLIADRICRNIDKPFLKKNAQFRELIANAIQYDNFYQKSFRVQFVTSNYMTHFKINEDYTTHLGQSVLYRSLFYAMLYLTLLLFKILMIMTRQGDLRMFLVKGNGVNKDVSGKMNKIISDFKQKQISYNDFGSVNGILSKVGQGKDIGVPVGANNERSFDIEMLQGSSIDLDEPLLELLRKGMISNTGCPSAIMNYMEEVDFAKQIAMTQIKFITRVISMQCELEPACTDVYRKLLRFGGYNISDDDLDSFSFQWSRPKTLNTQNVSELIGTADQLAEFMVKVFEGDNSINDARIKDRFFAHFVKKYLLNGVFDWDELEHELKALTLELRADIQEEEATKITADQDQS